MGNTSSANRSRNIIQDKPAVEDRFRESSNKATMQYTRLAGQIAVPVSSPLRWFAAWRILSSLDQDQTNDDYLRKAFGECKQ